MALSINNSKPQNGSEIEEITVGFPKFDVVSDESDHYYRNCKYSLGSRAHKKIMREWNTLQKHLPDSIYVRAYENRIELLRAVIVGAAATPYHDGLYFFDLAFPNDYPARPPVVYYRSFGLRLNPNLYANGRVCLSLINTWSGKKSELWNPKESTILQVLLSIQALVLNEKPYFNEPGNNVWPRNLEKKSVAYNEDVILLSCKTMMFLLRRPPRHFEEFVRAHFRARAIVILSAFEAYMNGQVIVGYYNITNHNGLSCKVADVSPKFKRSMEQLFPQLAMEFSRTRAPLGHFDEQVKASKEAAIKLRQSRVAVKKKKKRSWTMGKVFGRLKRFLGLKKSTKSKLAQ